MFNATYHKAIVRDCTVILDRSTDLHDSDVKIVVTKILDAVSHKFRLDF